MGNYSDEKVQLANKLNANFEGFTMNTELRNPKTLRYNERYIVGGFSEEEVLDLCRAFNNREKAGREARLKNEICFWDNLEMVEIH